MAFGDDDAEGFLSSLALGQTVREGADDREPEREPDQDSRHVDGQIAPANVPRTGSAGADAHS